MLDVGAGSGKYGVLFREYLELRHAEPTALAASSEAATTRRVRIDGVDGFAPYIGPLHQYAYDEVFVEDIATALHRDWTYGIIFMGDVLEHLEERQAVELIVPEVVRRARMGVLVSVPSRVRDQDAAFGNQYEIHRSLWSNADFLRAAPFAFVGLKGSHRTAFLTSSEACFSRGARKTGSPQNGRPPPRTA